MRILLIAAGLIVLVLALWSIATQCEIGPDDPTNNGDEATVEETTQAQPERTQERTVVEYTKEETLPSTGGRGESR